ncbi:protein SDA1, partial [Mytilus galloprovincialis]
MSDRNHNKLPNNLPQLQNLIKRDPNSYREEFLQQYRHFQSNLQIFQLKPSEYSKTLEELVLFLSQVSGLFPEDSSDFPQQLWDVLKVHSTVLDRNMRM